MLKHHTRTYLMFILYLKYSLGPAKVIQQFFSLLHQVTSTDHNLSVQQYATINVMQHTRLPPYTFTCVAWGPTKISKKILVDCLRGVFFQDGCRKLPI